MQIYDDILKSLRRRIIEEKPDYLLDKNPEVILDGSISILYDLTRSRETSFAIVTKTIGKEALKSLSESFETKKATKLGAFILYSFQEVKIIKVVLGKNTQGNSTYLIKVFRDDLLTALKENLTQHVNKKLPFKRKPFNWYKGKLGEQYTLIKRTENQILLNALTDKRYPIIFNVVNKLQKTAWKIDSRILQIQKWALEWKMPVFDNIFKELNSMSKDSKLRETEYIIKLGEKFEGETFYHLWAFDFRGRAYCHTAYLNTQGTDQAKALHVRKDTKAIGPKGFEWLCFSIATLWAGECGKGYKTDKISFDARILWTLENIDKLLDYARKPTQHVSWMAADKPWTFLRAVFEFKKILEWEEKGNDITTFKSSLEVYLDGACNGLQHLAALSKDKQTAYHVNLRNTNNLPEDLYLFLAKKLWKHITNLRDGLEYKEAKDSKIIAKCFTNLKLRKLKVSKYTFKKIIEEEKGLRKHLLYKMSAIPFWLQITSSGERRKVVKRGILTLPYGSTRYGITEQIIEDSKKHKIDILRDLERAYAVFLGHELYKICQLDLEKPMKLLEIFKSAGKKHGKSGKYLSWTLPITNFPVVQFHTINLSRQILIEYGPKRRPENKKVYHDNKLRITIFFEEYTKIDNSKQVSGAAPNIVHSLDACHMMLIIDKSNFPISIIHDSFGALLGDVEDLYHLIREQFVRLYKTDPLTSILRDIKEPPFKQGDFDIEEVIDSKFSFL